jgi:acetyl-CoA acetyltransferase
MGARPAEAAVVGIGESAIGTLEGRTPIQICVDVALEAIADAGLERGDIDGLMSFGVLAAENGRDVHRHHIRVAEQLGLGPLRYSGTSKLGGGALGQTLREASLLIGAGHVRNVLVVGADAFRSGLGRDLAQGVWMDFHDQELEGPYGHTAPVQWAMASQRYAHRFGLDADALDDAMAKVAVSAREWGVLNPACSYDRPLTIDDVRASKLVSTPIRVLHCSRPIDGGSAFVVSPAGEAEGRGDHPPVYVRGTGARFSSYYMSAFPDLTDTIYELARDSCADALSEAGLTLDDLDVLYPYDGFAIMPLLILEAMGFAPRGQGVRLYDEGACSPGGRLPCNTHGGALNHGLPAFPGMLFFLTEAVRQLRGEAGERQVPGARTTLLHGWSGVGGVNASVALATTPA